MAQSLQVANSPTIIEEAVKLFSQQLTSERKRGPYKIEDSLAQAASAPEEDTRKIFLSKGRSVWLAYAIAKSASPVVSEGSHSHAEQLAAFEQLSVEDRKTVATRLVDVDIHSSLQSIMERIDPGVNPSKRRRLNDEPTFSPGLDAAIRHSSDPIVRSDASVTESAHTITRIPVDTSRDSDISHPLSKRLPPIFPAYICGAISKFGEKANLTMAFPADDSGRIGCLMSLSILPNKVQNVAKELFGTNIEIDGDIWYVTQENGGRLLAGADLHLQGAQDNAIKKLLGNAVYTAIDESPIRREEIREVILATSCVTLIITRWHKDGGVLNLNLEVGEGFGLKRLLFD